MIELKAKLWRSVGVAALAAGGAGLAACSPATQKAPEPAARAPVEEVAPATAPAAAGGEAGEAGAASAYSGLTPAQTTAVRLQHLKGFLLIAQKELAAGHGPEAGALIGQGVLEVYAPYAADFGGLDIGPVNAASIALLDAKPNGKAALDAALAAISAKQGPGDAETVRRMLGVTNGLYGAVIVEGGVDPIEYQHSQGAVLSARDAFKRAEPALKSKNPARAAEAKAELDRLVALWPTVQAPDAPAPTAQVAAQISRVELALSGL